MQLRPQGLSVTQNRQQKRRQQSFGVVSGRVAFRNKPWDFARGWSSLSSAPPTKLSQALRPLTESSTCHTREPLLAKSLLSVGESNPNCQTLVSPAPTFLSSHGSDRKTRLTCMPNLSSFIATMYFFLSTSMLKIAASPACAAATSVDGGAACMKWLWPQAYSVPFLSFSVAVRHVYIDEKRTREDRRYDA